jgi:excisionase family DNA binding protein
MTNNPYKTIDDLPTVLEPLDIQNFLGISKTKAYELVASKQFHVVKIGRLFKVPKESFVKWFLGE